MDAATLANIRLDASYEAFVVHRANPQSKWWDDERGLG
jgi:hypothetical protein